MPHPAIARLGVTAGGVTRLLAGFRDLLVPPGCLICRADTGAAAPGSEAGNPRPAGICAACWAGFPGLPEARCGVCGWTQGHEEYLLRPLWPAWYD